MTFYFAWVDPSTAFDAEVHSVEDEDVFSFTMTHAEGNFATLAVEIRNPQQNLLDPGRKLWAWLSEDGTPIFYGRLVAMPDDIVKTIVKLNFIARPLGFEAAKISVADTLKVAPYWDPIWIREQRREDPDAVLEARPALWHIDRLTHDVTVSDINSGEDGTVNFTTDEILYDSVKVKYGSAPLRRVSVKATVSWDQQAIGSLDFTSELNDAFKDAGSPSKMVSSWTGQGLQSDWPKQNDNFNGGWTVGKVELKRKDGRGRPVRSKIVKIVTANPVTQNVAGAIATATVAPQVRAQFYAWEFKAKFPMNYAVKRKYIETVAFTLEADVQPIIVEPGEDEAELLTFNAKVGEADPNDPYQVVPIGDLRLNSYMKTDAGVASLEYLINIARAHLLSRARAVSIDFTVPFSEGLALSCRKNASITDPRLPAGEAFGKIVQYQLTSKAGKSRCNVKIGCTIGTGNSVSAENGTPAWAEDDYVEYDYQIHEGGTLLATVGDVTWAEYRDTVVLDDGINFLALRTGDVLNDFSVINGEDDQIPILNQTYPDIPAAIEALNANFTEVVMDLVPLVGGPFETPYTITLSDLMIPQTIEL